MSKRVIGLKYVKIALGLVFVTIFGTFFATTEANGSGALQSLTSDNQVSWNNLEVGDVLANGVRAPADTCDFGPEPVNIHIDIAVFGAPRWLAISLDDQCKAVIKGKWEGALEDGPKEIVVKLMELLPYAAFPVPEEPLSTIGSLSATQPMGTTSCKTSAQNIYMMGYGGGADKLTQKNGTLEFCYNGSTATIDSQAGGCTGSSTLYWDWLVDSCSTTSVEYGPSSEVYRSGWGDYHCDPPGTFPCNGSNPDGYYHSLSDSEAGFADGSSTCSYGYGGQIVYGVAQNIILGCR